VTRSAWERARTGRPTVVVGHPGPAPDALHVLTGSLGPTVDLTALVEPVSTALEAVVAPLALPLGRRLLTARRPDARRIPLFPDPSTVALLHGASAMDPELLHTIEHWITRPRCAIVFQVDAEGVLTERFRHHLGDGAVVAGVARPHDLDRDATLLLLVGLHHGPRITATDWADHTGATPLAAMAHLEVLAHTLPLQPDGEGYVLDAAWIAHHQRGLSTTARAQPVLPPSSLDPDTAWALGLPTTSPPPATVLRAWETGSVAPPEASAAIRVQLAWDADDREAFHTALADLDAPERAHAQALADARWGESPTPPPDAWARAALPSWAPDHPVEDALEAIEELLEQGLPEGERGRLLVVSAELSARSGRIDHAAAAMGTALPLLHAEPDGLGLASAIARLTAWLEPDALAGLLGWLEAALQVCRHDPTGLDHCARALAGLEHALPAEGSGEALRRLSLQLGALRRGHPVRRADRRS
jgi:hypothetical protein